MRKQMTTLIVMTAVLLCALLVPAGPAPAQEVERVGLEISPPRVEVDLDGRSFSIPATLRNLEDFEVRVELSVSGLGHDLLGTPLFVEPAEATDLIELSAPAEVTMASGEALRFRIEGSLPDGEPSLYAAVIAEFAPVDAPAGQIESRSRVASLLLLRGPRPWEESVEVADVSIEAGPGKNDPLTVFAAVENTGNVHVKPRGRMRILKNGRLLDVVQLEEQNIIPTYARRLVGQWRAPKRLTGRVDLEVRIFDPDARGSGFVDFTEGGEVEAPGASITNFVARDENGPLAEFVLTNTGTIAIAPEISITASQGDRIVARTTVDQPEMSPGVDDIVQWRPDLDAGTYVFRAEARLGDQLLAEAVTGLRLEEGNPPWLWPAIAGGALLAVLLLLALLRRRRRDEVPEEE